MEWVALALLVALAVGWLALRRRAPATASPEQAPPALSPEEEAELEEGFARVEREAAGTMATLLAARLEVLVSRGVPLRAMRKAPAEHTARLSFADGTVLIARAERPGELYALAVRMRRQGVGLTSWHVGPEGTVLRFSWREGRADLVVLGLDQAD